MFSHRKGISVACHSLRSLSRTTYHFIPKRKIPKRSACESKTIKGSIHVFTQEGNQCGLSLLAFLILMAEIKEFL